MGFAELNGKYQRLRSELDAAYSGPVWNSRQIDEIAEQIVKVEFALASAQHNGHAGSNSFETRSASEHGL